MKPKKMKRLALHKNTVANLDRSEMSNVVGRGTLFAGSCDSEYPCGTSWDVCDPTICATICDWTEQAHCTFGCPPE